jgi:prepilin-type N-terminal cleavage/methylation domain-containing protein
MWSAVSFCSPDRRARLSLERARARGVTLIEVLIVLAIITVLGTLAWVGYRKITSAAKIDEAVRMVGDIQAKQEAHFKETNKYADVSLSINDTYPAAAPGAFETQWGGPCGNCKPNIDWRRLKVRADSPVYFGYATVAGVAGTTPGSSGVTITAKGTTLDFAVINGGAIKGPWYVVRAVGDTNGDGVQAQVVGSSFGGGLVVQDEE